LASALHRAGGKKRFSALSRIAARMLLLTFDFSMTYARFIWKPPCIDSREGRRIMKTHLTKLQKTLVGMIEKAKVRKGLLSMLGIFFILQVYFVRELVAAELLFVLVFAVLMVLGGMIYLVGAIGERGLDWMEAGVHFSAAVARRSYVGLEELSRKPFRHPRSESAQ
jgi:hypothetical protein